MSFYDLLYVGINVKMQMYIRMYCINGKFIRHCKYIKHLHSLRLCVKKQNIHMSNFIYVNTPTLVRERLEKELAS